MHTECLSWEVSMSCVLMIYFYLLPIPFCHRISRLGLDSLFGWKLFMFIYTYMPSGEGQPGMLGALLESLLSPSSHSWYLRMIPPYTTTIDFTHFIAVSLWCWFLVDISLPSLSSDVYSPFSWSFSTFLTLRSKGSFNHVGCNGSPVCLRIRLYFLSVWM